MSDRITTNVERIVDRALDSQDFQDWLARVGFAPRSPDHQIEDFSRAVKSVKLPRVLREILDALEPFGNLTTNRRIARSVYGSDGIADLNASRNALFRLHDRLEQLLPRELTQEIATNSGLELRGVGIKTGLTMTEFALVHEIEKRSANGSSSVANLAQDLFFLPHAYDPEGSERNVYVILCRIRSKRPPGISLERVGRPGVFSFRLQAPEHQPKPASNQLLFV